MIRRSILSALVLIGLAAGPAAAAPPQPDETPPPLLQLTPPRLAAVWGDVSFARPDEPEWSTAEVNTPLAPGDALSLGPTGTVEIQVGPRAFVRARPQAHLVLDIHEPGRLAFRLERGEAALDLVEPPPGERVEVRAGEVTIAIERPGLYRIGAHGDTTVVVARAGGRAALLGTGGPIGAVGSGEQAVVVGPRVQRGPAPAPDDFDRWSAARTAGAGATASAQHVATDVYGLPELDRHGDWRSTAEYGPVWVPQAVPAGWAPYSAGRWAWDPRFGWTWIDDAAWGWVPFHYGRWVHMHGGWAWSPGPRVRRAYYSPALVVFLGGHAPRGPVSWVALSWGEPVVPWWGPPAFAGRPWWGGWGGPRVVNNVIVHRTTVVDVKHITVYRNAHVHRAVVSVPHDRFQRSHVARARLADIQPGDRVPIHGRPPVRPAVLDRRDGDARPPAAHRRRDAGPAVIPRGGREVQAVPRDGARRDDGDGRRDAERRDLDRARRDMDRAREDARRDIERSREQARQEIDGRRDAERRDSLQRRADQRRDADRARREVVAPDAPRDLRPRRPEAGPRVEPRPVTAPAPVGVERAQQVVRPAGPPPAARPRAGAGQARKEARPPRDARPRGPAPRG
jgi:hypothetical protein